MLKSRAIDGERRVRRRRDSHSSLEDDEPLESRGGEVITQELDPEEVRRIRIERLEGRTSTRRSSSPKMTSESHATLPTERSSHRRRRDRHRDPDEKRHRRRRKSTPKDEEETYVYGPPTDRPKSSRITVSESRRLGRDGESSESEAHIVRSKSTREKPKEKKIRVVYVTKDVRSSDNKERRRSERELSDRPKEESIRRSRTHHSRRKSAVELSSSPIKRSTSTRDLPPDSRPVLRRSNTTTSHIPSAKAFPPVANTSARRASFFGGIFAGGPPQRQEPEKLVECLTCLSDDVPKSRSAKLKCGHRMCHSCLKRIFKLSVKDPQHMPPKCCTSDHIPLEHVEKLFKNDFKRTWNQKFAEFSTKNRIYCPARRCGEWIKPSNIHKEDGKKYGKCGRCKTKVCCLCNGKWHGSKDCPKDEETNRLLETAKQAGWQRCYSCRTMVELKEGCNHMTCRCTAEFCMICGLKWKTCNCPWFNYEAVEADRLNHMQVPGDIEEEQEPGQRPRRLRRPRPHTYVEEIDHRQRQERRDEAIARRMQRVSLEDDINDDYQGGIGDIHGVGNGAGHFMNQDYIRAAQNILTGNFDQATAAANYVMGVANARGVPPPRPGSRRMSGPYPVPEPPSPQRARPVSPPPVLRRHTMREQSYNAHVRPAERVIPARTRTDYEAEAAVHAPLARESRQRPEPRTSILAGLGVRGNRVSAWRAHVQPGVEPEEGMLSI